MYFLSLSNILCRMPMVQSNGRVLSLYPFVCIHVSQIAGNIGELCMALALSQ